MWVLLTGGAGYIGSHVLVHLLRARHHVVLVDLMVRGRESAHRRVQDACTLAGCAVGDECIVYCGDTGDRAFMRSVFAAHPDVGAVFHLAGSKSVRESCSDPLRYYMNNVANTLTLLDVMRAHAPACRRVFFASSATVYTGCNRAAPFHETDPCVLRAMTSPYAASKHVVERVLEDMVRAGQLQTAIVLRFFNPVGAHASGLLGDDCPASENLIPRLRVVLDAQPSAALCVYGNDYEESPDGTPVRDYVHVSDVARAHVTAFECALSEPDPWFDVVNIGTGRGMSVLQLAETARRQRRLPLPVPTLLRPRREGDVGVLVADVAHARRALRGFEASTPLDDVLGAHM